MSWGSYHTVPGVGGRGWAGHPWDHLSRSFRLVCELSWGFCEMIRRVTLTVKGQENIESSNLARLKLGLPLPGEARNVGPGRRASEKSVRNVGGGRDSEPHQNSQRSFGHCHRKQRGGANAINTGQQADLAVLSFDLPTCRKGTQRGSRTGPSKRPDLSQDPFQEA